MNDYLIWWIQGYKLESGIIRAKDKIYARVELCLWHYPQNVTVISIQKVES
jgi:hypothetical protein